jgi:hypothetical protein
MAASIWPCPSLRRASAYTSHGSSASSSRHGQSWSLWAKTLADPGQQPAYGRPVAGPRVGPDRLGVRALGGQQPGCPPVPSGGPGLANFVDERRLEVAAQHLVVHIALTTVDGDRQPVPVGEVVEQPVAAGGVQQLVAAVAGEDVQHARADQEVADAGAHAGEQGPCQVAPGHRPAPGEGRDGGAPRGQGSSPGGQVEHGQAGAPAAGASGQQRHLVRRQRLAVHGGEQPLDLPGPEAELVGADHAGQAGHLVAQQVQRGHSAPGQQHVAVALPAGEQVFEVMFCGGTDELVDVVDDQQRVRRRVGAGDGGQAAAGPAGGGVDAVPGDLARVQVGVLGEQGGLAIAGRRDDQGEAGRACRRQMGDESLPDQALSGDGVLGAGIGWVWFTSGCAVHRHPCASGCLLCRFSGFDSAA